MAELQNSVVTKIVLFADSSVNNRPPYIYAKQHDTNSRYIVATIKGRSGVIPVSGLAQLNAIKPDGTHCYTAGTINADGTITLEIKSQILAVPGTVSCDISLFSEQNSEDVLLTTSTFYIIVDETNYDQNAIESSNEFSTVTDALATMAQYSEEARQSAIAAEEALRQFQEGGGGSGGGSSGGDTGGGNCEDCDERLDALETQMADLLYKEISITSFTNNVNTVEIGSTVTAVTLSWAFNKTPSQITLDGVSQNTGSTGTKLTNQSISSAKTWTLRATDERNKTVSKTTSIAFYNGVYYGAAEIPTTINDAFIKSLTKKLSSGKVTSFSTNVTEGKYLWYCLPARYGECTFYLGVLPGGVGLVDTISFTNASGYKEDYYVYRSDYSGLGNKSVTVK